MPVTRAGQLFNHKLYFRMFHSGILELTVSQCFTIQKDCREQIADLLHSPVTYEPRCEKNGLRGFRLGPTQTGLHGHRRWLEA